MDPSLPKDLAIKIAEEDMKKRDLDFSDLIGATFNNGVWEITYASKDRVSRGGPGISYEINAYSGKILKSAFLR